MIATDVRGVATGLVARGALAKLRRQLGRAMGAAGAGAAHLSLSLVDDAEMRTLNRDYAGKDKPTDVLSFSMRDGAPTPAHSLAPSGEPELLGDVVISVETAQRQADEGGRDLGAELLHLAVHGLAHLLGYDHVTVEEERVMFSFESELRREAIGRGEVVDVPRPVQPATRTRRSRARTRGYWPPVK